MRNKRFWVGVLIIAATFAGVFFYARMEAPPAVIREHRATDQLVERTKEEQARTAVELAQAKKEVVENVARVREEARANVRALPPDVVAVRLRELLRDSRRE